MGLVGEWQEINIAEQLESPAQLGRRFYISDVEASLAAFNSTINGATNHGSVCAVTCVYKMDMHPNLWAVNTMVLDGLFVSGRIGNESNNMFVRIGLQNGIQWGNQLLNDVFCFPGQNAAADSHTERAIVFLLSNTDLDPHLNGTLSAILIHIKNMQTPCRNCYQAMINAEAVEQNNNFINGRGSAQLYGSRGNSPVEGGIPISIGVGHYIEERVPNVNMPSIHWYDKYYR